MKIYQLTRVQTLPVSLDKAWSFFSHPNNLETITPKKVKFVVLSDPKEIENMYPGLIIRYKISPFLNIYFNWVTEITHVKENEFFVDEQRVGPYAMWHHKHFFKEVNGQTEMTDLLHYAMPFGFIGRIAHALFIKKQVEEIFNFRYKVLEEIF